MTIPWSIYRHLENSTKDFLETKVSEDILTDLSNNEIPIYINGQEDDTWTIPNISITVSSQTSPRFEIGSNLRFDRYLIIFDIYAENKGQQIDLAGWLRDILEDGFEYRKYAPNSSTPTEPTYEIDGWVNVDFLSNTPINLGENAGELDRFRHRITINVWIS